MANTTEKSEGFTVSGPDVDKRYASDGQAISAALTFAERHKAGDADFYVRNAAGNAVARVERRGSGSTVRRLAVA